MSKEHLPLECTNRFCGWHRDLWAHYEATIAPKMHGDLTDDEKQAQYNRRLNERPSKHNSSRPS